MKERVSVTALPRLVGLLGRAALVTALVALSAPGPARSAGPGTVGEAELAPPTALRAPTLEGWQVAPLARAEGSAPEADDQALPLRAQARVRHAPVYRFTSKGRTVVGRVRYGSELPASEALQKPGCARGAWHEVPGQAYVCTAEGFTVDQALAALPERIAAPDADRVEPFVFAKVEEGRPRYYRIPTVEEEQAALALGARAGELDVVQKVLDGIYFVAVVAEEEHGGRSFVRTSRGRYLRAEHIEELAPTGMHGELLDDTQSLPLAFIWGGSTTLFHVVDGVPRAAGVAEKHARFEVRGSLVHGEERYLVGPQGVAVKRAAARVAERVEPPAKIPAGAKWLHVNLAEQTLVAYEGARPVLATLVSSGIPERATPDGLYRLERKYLTKTMAGPDDEKGWYEVAEVPWTFYYRGNYAIHGAYWHDVFGQTRSHGCTNIPPADARWLFGWLDPKLPGGWHAALWQEQGWASFTEAPVRVELINAPTAMR